MISGYAGGDPKNTKVRLRGGSAVLNVIAVFVVIVMVSAAVFYFFGDRIMELIFPPAPVKISAVDVPAPYQLPVEAVVEESDESAAEETPEVAEVTPEVVEEAVIVEEPIAEPAEVVVIEEPPAAAMAPTPAPIPVAEAVPTPAPVVIAEVIPEEVTPIEEESPVEEEYAEEIAEDEYVEETPVVAPAPVAVAPAPSPAPAPRSSASVAVALPSVAASPVSAAPSTPPAVASAPVSRSAPQPQLNAKSQYAVYITLAKAALDEDNEKEAQRNFLKAYLLIPNSEVAYNIAIIYLQRNLPDRAVAWIRRVELNEQDAGDLIIAMVNAGHKRAASAALSHLISQDKEGYIYYSSAYLKEFNGNIEGASGDYKTAMQRSGYDDYITYAYARSLDQLGQISEARSYYAAVASSTNRDLSSAAAQRLETLR
jgi:tetratricopeptide (TPR) repeat protein